MPTLLSRSGAVPYPVQLPVAVPLAACQAEARQVTTWSPLYMNHQGKYAGWRVDWRAFALAGYSEDPLDVRNPWTKRYDGDRSDHRPVVPSAIRLTSAASWFPACLAVADAIPGPNERVRIVALGSGSIIPRHADPSFTEWAIRRTVRIHVPLLTGPGVLFLLWDSLGVCHDVCHPAGSVWLIDTNYEHAVANGEPEDRLHLIVDKFLTEELKAYLWALAEAQRPLAWP